MKKKVFKIGDRVGKIDQYNDDEDKVAKLRYDFDNEPSFGVISELEFDNQVIVKWDQDSFMEKVNVNLLFLENDLKTKWSKLEEEFYMIEKEVENKLKEAGKILKEANKLAKKTGRDLAEMYDAVSPLINVMDSCGWRSSSWGC
jgi:hypothetical protein